MSNLPSADSAAAVVAGDHSVKSWALLAAHAAARGTMIGAGAWAAGVEPRTAAVAGAAGALTIELAIIGRMYAAQSRGEQIPKDLPTQNAVIETLDRPTASSVAKVIGTTAGRAALLAAGFALVGLRGETLARAAVGGSLAVEAFVVGWTIYHRRKQ